MLVLMAGLSFRVELRLLRGSAVPQNPLYVAGKPLPDGNLELSVGDPDVQYDAEEKKWKAWWSTGAAKTFADGTNAPVHIKYAESPDGLTWTVQPEPVLRSGQDPTNWDNTKVETPCVVKVASNPPDRRYLMFYSGGNDTDFPKLPTLDYTWYQLGVAFSADGKKFTRMPAAESPYAGKSTGFRKHEGLLLMARDAFPGTANVESGVVADPEVVFDGSGYHLFFSSLAARADRTSYLAYGVSHATLTAWRLLSWRWPAAILSWWEPRSLPSFVRKTATNFMRSTIPPKMQRACRWCLIPTMGFGSTPPKIS
jgi:hypothetical protein